MPGQPWRDSGGQLAAILDMGNVAGAFEEDKSAPAMASTSAWAHSTGSGASAASTTMPERLAAACQGLPVRFVRCEPVRAACVGHREPWPGGTNEPLLLRMGLPDLDRGCP